MLKFIAAKIMLNENHQNIHVNKYNYHEKRIKQHYAVIIVQFKINTNAVSVFVIKMHTIIKNIRYFLMIEIKNEIFYYDSSDALSQIVFENVMMNFSKNLYDGVFRYDLEI